MCVCVCVCVCVAGRRHKSGVGPPSIPGPPRANLVGRRIQHVWTDGHMVWKGTVLEQVRGYTTIYMYNIYTTVGSLPNPAHIHHV